MRELSVSVAVFSVDVIAFFFASGNPLHDLAKRHHELLCKLTTRCAGGDAGDVS